jgi:hypothetical protein
MALLERGVARRREIVFPRKDMHFGPQRARQFRRVVAAAGVHHDFLKQVLQRLQTREQGGKIGRFIARDYGQRQSGGSHRSMRLRQSLAHIREIRVVVQRSFQGGAHFLFAPYRPGRFPQVQKDVLIRGI